MNVNSVADAGDEDFGAKVVIVVNLLDVRDQRHSVEAVVIVAAYEG